MWRRAGSALLVLLGLAAGVEGFVIEPTSLRVRDERLALRSAPAPLAGLRIAVISDLHAGAPYIDAAKIDRVVALSNAEQPDLVLLTGDVFVNDVIGGHPLDPALTAAALNRLQARLGVFLVFGNHDHDTDMAALRRLLAGTSIRVMDNAVQRIDVGDAGHFWLLGLADFKSDHPDITGTLAQIGDEAPILAFTHNPDLFPQLPARVNLLVAGHTHGGQVRLPLFGRGPLPSRYGRRFAAGHVVEQTDLFVSTGIGTSHIPVRFGVPPEITLLTLTQAASP